MGHCGTLRLNEVIVAYCGSFWLIMLIVALASLYPINLLCLRENIFVLNQQKIFLGVTYSVSETGRLLQFKFFNAFSNTKIFEMQVII